MVLIYQYKLLDRLNVLNVMVWEQLNLELLVNVLNVMVMVVIWQQEEWET